MIVATTLQRDAMAWAQAKPFLDELRRYHNVLTIQQLRTIRGQALSGDVRGARKGLVRLLEERGKL